MTDTERQAPELPPVREDIGIPTPPSPGRVPPIHLPPEPDHDDGSGKDRKQQG